MHFKDLAFRILPKNEDADGRKFWGQIVVRYQEKGLHFKVSRNFDRSASDEGEIRAFLPISGIK